VAGGERGDHAGQHLREAQVKPKLTKAQERWLREINREGFVEMGGWGSGQKNRPLFALVDMGLAEFGFGPKGSFLKTQGFMPTKAGKEVKV